jgi:hypothetical protein
VFSSRKEMIALAVAVGAGAGVTFLLKYAGWSGTYSLFAFQILIIPLIANIADHRKFGSAHEFVETRILGGFLENDEFGLGDRHALGLEQ